VWNAAKSRDLLDSLYRGYPDGTLMFWETGADVGTRQVGGGDSDKVAKLLIVDGQQTLTEGENAGSGEGRSRLAAEIARTGRAFSWPPSRNDVCWCGSGRKYKKCCGPTPPAEDGP